MHRLLKANDFPDFVFLQEVRATDSLQAAFRKAPHCVEAGCCTSAPRYEAHFNMNRSQRRHHGVLIYIRADRAASSTVRNVDWDNEGRVQVVEMPSFNLALFNV